VPVYQHDFGCCDALIDGGPALQKARLDLAGESEIFRKPSRTWV
jgi:hypothetical protein